MGAEQTPIPSVSPATAALTTPTPSPVPLPNAATGLAEQPSVRAVGVQRQVDQDQDRAAKVIYAKRGDVIWVDIINLFSER